MLPSFRFCCFVVVGLVVAAPAMAGPVTLAWDRNPEAFVAGYLVQLGVDPDRLDWEIDVGSQTWLTLPELPAPMRVYFRVIAYTASGLRSLPSETVFADPPAGEPTSSPIPEAWRQWHGLGADDDDPDGDGVTNLAEYRGGTDPTLPNQWFLGEGATGVFRMRVALANPSFEPADVQVRFLGEDGPRGSLGVQVPAFGRRTLWVNDLPQLANAAFSAIVSSTRGGVVVERTMSWGGRGGGHLGRAGHTGRPPAAPAREWYFAEGAAGFFDTYFLIANPTPRPAVLDVEFHDDRGAVHPRRYTVGPSSRLTIATSALPQLAGRSFATRLVASEPVGAERAMYFGVQGGLWRGGHVSSGVTNASTSWYLAEGCTGPFFDTYLLVANPGSREADVLVRYLTPGGQAFERRLKVAPRSRVTIAVDSEPGLEDTAVSMAVTASRPVVVERSMYWAGDATGWREAHSAPGTTTLGRRWVLAEGETAGVHGAETYVLVMNPGSSWADATVTFLRESGAPVSLVRRIAPRSRLTVSAGEARLPWGARFGVLVEANQPVAVERSMYWTSEGVSWSGGTSEVGLSTR